MELTNTVTEAVLNQVGSDIYRNATEKGFRTPPDEDVMLVCTKLVLIHSEVSEAMEVLRKPYPDERAVFAETMSPQQTDDFLEELADIVIRTLDLANWFDPNFGKVIIAKMEKNRSRPAKHGKRF